MTESALKVRIIEPFKDGVIIHYPDSTDPAMISLEKRGAYWIGPNSSHPMTLVMLARCLAEWFKRDYKKGDLVHGNIETNARMIEILGWTYKTVIWHPDLKASGNLMLSDAIVISDIFIKLIKNNKKPVPITIPEAAEILKEWYS